MAGIKEKSFMPLLRSRSHLMALLRQQSREVPENRIAVEAHIFTRQGKIILERRGPHVRDEVGKLEGIGGSVGNHEDLLEALLERIECEVGIDRSGLKDPRMLEVRLVTFQEQHGGPAEWAIVSYLFTLVEGEPTIGELDMIESLHELTIDELMALPDDSLSRSTAAARVTYWGRYQNRPYYEIEAKR